MEVLSFMFTFTPSLLTRRLVLEAWGLQASSLEAWSARGLAWGLQISRGLEGLAGMLSWRLLIDGLVITDCY